MPFFAAETAIVQTTQIWPSDTNIIEFDPPDDQLANQLKQTGCRRFLAVVSKNRADNSLAELQKSGQVVQATGKLPISRNNADALVLCGTAALSIWRFRNFRQARYVAFRNLNVLVAGAVALGCCLQLLLGRLRWDKAVSLGGKGHGRSLFVFEVCKRRENSSARKYIPHSLQISGFLRKLSQSELKHVVLRWFENLPELPPGEDLDLLVADEHLPAVCALLNQGPGLAPCDVYSVTGLPGSDFRGLPYFPPHLATTLLTNAQQHPSHAKIPSPADHFFSLAYHAIYHKGKTSGLPSRGQSAASRATQAEHDYVAVLSSLAQTVGLKPEMTFEGLDECLQAAGWRPPRDMLVRLAKKRKDLACLIGKVEDSGADPGLAVFLIREAAAFPESLARLVVEIEREGFQILRTKVFTEAESHAIGRTIRGGNWGRGPWPACGGLPAAAIIVYDSEPIPVSRREKKRYPELCNARLLCKSKIRDSFNRSLPADQHVNALHSSDNGIEAIEYIQIIMPEALEGIQAQVAGIRSSFQTQEPVVLQLSAFRRRAKTEVIRFNERLAVKKTFKSHQRSYCQREAWAMANLSRVVSAVPPLLATEGESVIYPYYNDVLRFRRSSGRLLPLPVAKEAIAALRQIYDAGYALIDAHPENVIVDREHGVKLIDFEFLHEYDQKPARFEQSFDVIGCPADFAGSQPDGGAKFYARHWQPYIGLSFESLLHDPTWLQHLKRAVYMLVSSPRMLPRRLREIARIGWRQLVRKPIHPKLPTVPEPLEKVPVRRRIAA
jgi:hypothetical protein